MKTYTSCLLLVIVLLLVSCENELPFNIKDNPPKLVMNALINADSLSNLVFLNLTGKDKVAHLQNATVEVRVNGVLKESVRPLPAELEGDPQCRFRITGPFAPGEVVRLDATTDDGAHHAWAEVTVPQRPEQIKVDTFKVTTAQMKYNNGYLGYKIAIQDRPRENNYYRLVIDKRIILDYYDNNQDENVIQTFHDYRFIDREDVVLTDGHPTTEDDEDNGMFDTVKNIYGVFDDSRFRDASYVMTVYSDIDFYDSLFPFSVRHKRIDIIVHLLSITEEEYYYMKALNLVDSDIYDETIYEPIKYPSNVHGGTGLVSISTEVSQTIPINNTFRKEIPE